MARIKYSALIEDIRGSIGGTTFQRNQYGFSVRRKPNMTIPNKTLQERQKPFVARATRAWRGLTASQRTAWGSFATSNPQPIKNDPSVPMSGYAVFVRLNVFRQLSGDSLYTSAPTITVPTASIEIDSVQTNSINIELGYTATGDDDDFEKLIFMTSTLGAGVTAIRNRLRFIASRGVLAGSINIDGGEYIAVFGENPASGVNVGVYVVMYVPTNGIIVKSERVVLTTIVL